MLLKPAHIMAGCSVTRFGRTKWNKKRVVLFKDGNRGSKRLLPSSWYQKVTLFSSAIRRCAIFPMRKVRRMLGRAPRPFQENVCTDHGLACEQRGHNELITFWERRCLAENQNYHTFMLQRTALHALRRSYASMASSQTPMENRMRQKVGRNEDNLLCQKLAFVIVHMSSQMKLMTET